ncbi:MAG: nucleotidyl transferase AbiEii/AbiGii toxin family protein [Candidatus Diapherotrites archaeon]|nr:nucleotidyl transferase AbiEii/AbiGii toxin family protein [Candidatus Diapherotrites archaeon]
MLTQSELKAYGHIRGLKTLDQIRKDYLQDVILSILCTRFKDLVFKGGTAIWKLFGGNRFSEDLDFSCKEISDELIPFLIRELRLRGFNTTVLKQKRTKNMLRVKTKIDAPNMRNIIISIEILIEEEDETEEKMLFPPYPDIPSFIIKTLTLNAIAEGKICAIIQRDKPRDVHDLYFLLKRGAIPNINRLKRRCDYNATTFRNKLKEKKRMWKSLEPLVIGTLPSFDEEAEYILSKLAQ